MTRSKTNDNKADQVFSLFLGMTHTFTIRFIKHRKPATLLLRNIQSLPQNLKNWPFRLLFMLYSILIDLCVGSARLTNSTVSLYIYVAAIFVLWADHDGSVLPLGSGSLGVRHAWAKAPLRLIPSVGLKSAQKSRASQLSQAALIARVFLFPEWSCCFGVWGCVGSALLPKAWRFFADV